MTKESWLMEGVFTHSDQAPRTESYNLQRAGIPHSRKGIFCHQFGWYAFCYDKQTCGWWPTFLYGGAFLGPVSDSVCVNAVGLESADGQHLWVSGGHFPLGWVNSGAGKDLSHLDWLPHMIKEDPENAYWSWPHIRIQVFRLSPLRFMGSLAQLP